MAINITSANFESEVLKSEGLTILKFGAAWCGPCKKLDPIIQEIANDNDGLKVCYIDIDSEREIPVNYGVLSVPTTLFFKDGKVLDTIVGLVPKNKLQKVIDKNK
ncbi:MAG: thiol reductase thioredoxin [Candidatus Cloacimonadota bacterium]|nr:MAG: thiol reductase thioredoxin [Candidatus Cloacimonadota bacterium]PIE78489.1 MAG: thiol reductase thioredoxin [Candidatus Delongbacteria bacterium]